MKHLILIFIVTFLLQPTISLSEGLEDWEETFTIWDVLESKAINRTYNQKSSNTYSYELDQETIFHINDPKNEGIHDILYDVYPVIKVEFFYLFGEEQGGGLGYLGQFEYKSLLYGRKQALGARIRTSAGYNPYH